MLKFHECVYRGLVTSVFRNVVIDLEGLGQNRTYSIQAYLAAMNDDAKAVFVHLKLLPKAADVAAFPLNSCRQGLLSVLLIMARVPNSPECHTQCSVVLLTGMPDARFCLPVCKKANARSALCPIICPRWPQH